MNEAAQTLEGWYALHDFYHINWNAWKAASAEERRLAGEELKAYAAECAEADKAGTGSFAFYTIVGQKADFVFVHLAETLEKLNELETKFRKTAFAPFAAPAYSYVSIVELSNYTSKPGENPMERPEIAARLKPSLPKTKHICFYPMNKRRLLEDNWYMLPMEERRKMMHSHGMIGRSYAGKVRQIITGSVGLDDWEWGVTLFADDALHFKKLIYEMRFDEVSARYGEFGQFFVGNLTDADQLIGMMS